jgi:hypothetical protein
VRERLRQKRIVALPEPSVAAADARLVQLCRIVCTEGLVVLTARPRSVDRTGDPILVVITLFQMREQLVARAENCAALSAGVLGAGSDSELDDSSCVAIRCRLRSDWPLLPAEAGQNTRHCVRNEVDGRPVALKPAAPVGSVPLPA